jgi:GT2 family glycosyltransferase
MNRADHGEVSVAVATVGRPDELARCLDALLGADVLPREILVVDQGVDERTRMVVADRGRAATPVQHIRQERRGLAASRNLALRTARFPILAMTDDDCVPSSSWVAAVARVFSHADATHAVTGPVLPLGSRPGAYAVSSRTSMEPAEYRGLQLPWVVGTGANISVRRELALEVGGYDERLGVGSGGGAGEDLDFIHRLLRAGATIRYEPTALVYHELQTKERRRGTRSSYGRGVGACCAFWLRSGDARALWIFARWIGMRGRRLGKATFERDSERAREELFVLGGTAGGFAYGLRRRNAAS